LRCVGRSSAPTAPQAADTLSARAALARGLRDFAAAERLVRDELEIHRKVHGPDSAEAAVALHDLGDVLADAGRAREGEASHRDAVTTCRKALGDEHPDLARGLGRLGGFLLLRGRPAGDAVPVLEEALGLCPKAFGGQDDRTAEALHDLGRALSAAGRHADAERRYREALELRRAASGDAAPATAEAVSALVKELEAQEKFDEAVTLLLEHQARVDAAPGGGIRAAFGAAPVARPALPLPWHGCGGGRMGEAADCPAGG
jgi:tetratricopeptide (TPR) repeat protein